MKAPPFSLLLLASVGTRAGLSRAFTPPDQGRAEWRSPSSTEAGSSAARRTSTPSPPRDVLRGAIVLRSTDVDDDAGRVASQSAVAEVPTLYQMHRALLEARLRMEGSTAEASSPTPSHGDGSDATATTPYQMHRALLEARLRMEGRSAAEKASFSEGSDGEDSVVMSRKAALDSPLDEAISRLIGEDGSGTVVEGDIEDGAQTEASSSLSVSTDTVASGSADASENSDTASEIAEKEVKRIERGGNRGLNMLSHSDIEWRLRPPRETKRLKRLSLKLAANLIRLDCKLKREDPPNVLCPKGGQAVLEAYYKGPGKRRKKRIARFGITTERGPRSAEIDETVAELFDANLPLAGAGVAAIIYMFVEPDFRGRGIGELALEAVSAIHTSQGCDFTVLVADDDGSGKLVEWYEANGFSRAPRLQRMMGSPDGKFGTTMIAPTAVSADFFETVKIKWW